LFRHEVRMNAITMRILHHTKDVETKTALLQFRSVRGSKKIDLCGQGNVSMRSDFLTNCMYPNALLTEPWLSEIF